MGGRGSSSGGMRLYTDASYLINKYDLRFKYDDTDDAYVIPKKNADRLREKLDDKYLKVVQKRSGFKTSSRAFTIAGRQG